MLRNWWRRWCCHVWRTSAKQRISARLSSCEVERLEKKYEFRLPSKHAVIYSMDNQPIYYFVSALGEISETLVRSISQHASPWQSWSTIMEIYRQACGYKNVYSHGQQERDVLWYLYWRLKSLFQASRRITSPQCWSQYETMRKIEASDCDISAKVQIWTFSVLTP